MRAMPGGGPKGPDALARARAAALVHQHHRTLLRVAQHWSATPDDAQDAVQRALEIYMRRIDSLDPATELAWLRVVVLRTNVTTSPLPKPASVPRTRQTRRSRRRP